MTEQTRHLYVNADVCRGCLCCELACSFKHEREFNPALARLHVVKDDWGSLEMAVVCNQCGKCARACTRNAILRQGRVWQVDRRKCNGCGECLAACPNGVIFIHHATRKAIKCDTCGGQPECVRFCPYGAISFLEPAEIARLKRCRLVTAEGMGE